MINSKVELNAEERVSLRDELIEGLKKLSLIVVNKKDYYRSTVKIEELKKVLLNIPKYSLYVKQFNCEEEALYCLLHIDDISNHICPICNSYSSFNPKTYKYNKTCGNIECIEKLANSDEARKKLVQTVLKKYGVRNVAQSEKVQKKIRETTLKIYGVEHVLSSEDIKAKSRETMLQRYGVEYPIQSEVIREKSRLTTLKKYGVDNAMKSEYVKEKIKNTFIETYGVDHPMKTKEIQDKVKDTILKKYGCEYFFQSSDFKEKAKQTSLQRYNCEYPSQSEEVKDKVRKQRFMKKARYLIFTEDVNDAIESLRKDCCNPNIEFSDVYGHHNYFKFFVLNLYRKKDRLLRLKEVANIFHVNPEAIKKRAQLYGILDCFYIQGIKMETLFKSFLNEHNIKYTTHNRSIIFPQEIDFVFDGNNVGVEINDMYTHNAKTKDKNYHLLKTLLAKENKFRLIHLWEWELNNQQYWNRLYKWLFNIIDPNKTYIDSTKDNYEVRNVSVRDEKRFINKYSIQTYKKSDVCLGLYDKNTKNLIQLMSFCKYKTNDDYKLIRMVTKYGIIIEDYCKIFESFVNRYNPNSVISYCDLSKFDSRDYEKLGFEVSKMIDPQLVWYDKLENEVQINSPLEFVGIDKQIFSENKLSNSKAIFKYGHETIYNCGLSLYTWKKK